ncbi:hypothetical protein AAC387_Pa10g0366 [Persea americana]
MSVGLKDSQGDSSKKEECITTEQDIYNKVPVVSTSSGLSDLVSPTSGTKDERQNTSPKDVLVITTSDMSLESDGDHRTKSKEALDIISNQFLGLVRHRST